MEQEIGIISSMNKRLITLSLVEVFARKIATLLLFPLGFILFFSSILSLEELKLLIMLFVYLFVVATFVSISVSFYCTVYGISIKNLKIKKTKAEQIPVIIVFGLLFLFFAGLVLTPFIVEDSSFKHHVYYFNQDLLVTHTGQIKQSEHRGRRERHSYYSIELANGMILKEVNFLFPDPHLPTGGTYQYLMTPDLQSIIKTY